MKVKVSLPLFLVLHRRNIVPRMSTIDEMQFINERSFNNFTRNKIFYKILLHERTSVEFFNHSHPHTHTHAHTPPSTSPVLKMEIANFGHQHWELGQAKRSGSDGQSQCVCLSHKEQV